MITAAIVLRHQMKPKIVENQLTRSTLPAKDTICATPVHFPIFRPEKKSVTLNKPVTNTRLVSNRTIFLIDLLYLYSLACKFDIDRYFSDQGCRSRKTSYHVLERQEYVPVRRLQLR